MYACRPAELAFCENPNDEDLRKTLEDTAKLSNKFEQLVSIYKDHLSEFQGDTRFEMMRHVAKLSIVHLSDVEGAV